MTRPAMLLALLISAQAAPGSGLAWAADGGFSSDLPGEVRGLIVLKLPFGGPEVSSAPRLGFDFHMQQKNEYDDLRDSYDPDTGRRLPEIDTGTSRTWWLDPPDFRLPEERRGRPDPTEPRGRHPKLG